MDLRQKQESKKIVRQAISCRLWPLRKQTPDCGKKRSRSQPYVLAIMSADWAMVNDNWLTASQGLGRYLESRPNDPISWLIGAGASMTSGGPTTATVIRFLEQGTRGRIAAGRIREQVTEITDHEKRMYIEPLFQEFRPYIGYRCLAALGRSRQIRVLNLNWDMGIETACRVAGVECESITLFDRGAVGKIARKIKQMQRGVICVHLHGTLLGGLRLGTLETLKFDEQQRRLFARDFFSQPTIIVGASLSGDYDIEHMLGNLAASSIAEGDVKPLWTFLRADEKTPISTNLRKLHDRRQSHFNLLCSPNIDFDRILLQLQCTLRHVGFNDFSASTRAALPDEQHLVYPRSSLLRHLLDERLVVFSGHAKLGKTTAAHLLAHWIRLYRDGVSVRTIEEPGRHIQEVGTLDERHAQQILILDDPFGSSDHYEAEPGLLPQLQRVADLRKGPIVIATTRPGNWERALRETPLARPIRVVQGSDAGWYDPAELEPLRQAFDVPADVQNLTTPARIYDEAARRMRGLDHLGDVEDRLAEKIQILTEFPDVGAFATLARLQELSAVPVPKSQLLELVSTADPVACVRGATGIVRSYSMDDQTYVQLEHHEDREAVDRFLLQPGSFCNLALKRVEPWITDAQLVWERSQAAKQGEAISPLSGTAASEWAPGLLAISPRPLEVLAAVDHAQLDFWSLCDLVLVVLRRWEQLRQHQQVRQFIDNLVADKNRYGLYVLLEAALYLQRSTHPEIWDLLQARMWHLARDIEARSFEASLVFDGLAWREPATERFRTSEWLSELLRLTPAQHPRMGAFAFAYIYHPESFRGAPFNGQLHGIHPRDAIKTLAGDQADSFCQMLRWHFVHQSRARALMHRHERGTLKHECLFRDIREHPMEADRSAEIIAVLNRLGDYAENAGWAYHLGLNAQAVAGRLPSQEVLRKLLSRAPHLDSGVLSAVLTYEIPQELLPDIRTYFHKITNLNGLCESFWKGLHIEGIAVKPPRFRYNRAWQEIHRTLDLRWRHLRQSGLNVGDPHLFATELRRRLSGVRADLQPAAGTILERIDQGDFSLIEAAAAARAPLDRQIDDPYLRVLLQAAVELDEGSQK